MRAVTTIERNVNCLSKCSKERLSIKMSTQPCYNTLYLKEIIVCDNKAKTRIQGQSVRKCSVPYYLYSIMLYIIMLYAICKRMS